MFLQFSSKHYVNAALSRERRWRSVGDARVPPEALRRLLDT
jgi:hypothetical protein